MKRGAPLKRYTRLKAKGNTSHAKRQRDFEYMAFVRSRPCIARLLVTGGYECEGRIEADHVGGRYGQDSDRRCIPLCSLHHRQRTGVVGGRGLFAGWSLDRKREWGRQAVAETLRAWEGR